MFVTPVIRKRSTTSLLSMEATSTAMSSKSESAFPSVMSTTSEGYIHVVNAWVAEEGLTV